MATVFSGPGQEKPQGMIQQHPYLLVMIAAVVALAILAFLTKKGQATPPVASQYGDTSGLTFDQNGKPILYVPHDKFLNYTSDSETSLNERSISNSDNTTYPAGTPPPLPPVMPWQQDGGTNGAIIPFPIQYQGGSAS